MAVTSATQKPEQDYHCVWGWERSLDPWHKDAFPDGFKHAGTNGERQMGWMGVDWAGNPIIFVPDGTEA